MSNKIQSVIETNYRKLYGKLFSGLINQFGVNCINEIEDAIQNSFLKSLKTWHVNKFPDNKENWLFIVARNDVLSQLKRKPMTVSDSVLSEISESGTTQDDLRLQTILFLSSSKKVSAQLKVVLILKNIFGLSIREISENTLLNEDAIYKRISRARDTLRLEFAHDSIDDITEGVGEAEIALVEEVLYAVFNIGFDSFNENIQSIVNEDLCLEALALAKLLLSQYHQDSTKNLIALFCFHVARIPAKIDGGKFVPFLKQDQSKWDKKVMSLGFGYLQKPEKLNRFYIESLIASKYMMTRFYDDDHWNEIVKLYELLLTYHQSPIVKLNLCYGLHKARQSEKALNLLFDIEKEMPEGHIYFSLVKAALLKTDTPGESESIFSSVFDKLEQTIRKEHLLENGFITL